MSFIMRCCPQSCVWGQEHSSMLWNCSPLMPGPNPCRLSLAKSQRWACWGRVLLAWMIWTPRWTLSLSPPWWHRLEFQKRRCYVTPGWTMRWRPWGHWLPTATTDGASPCRSWLNPGTVYGWGEPHSCWGSGFLQTRIHHTWTHTYTWTSKHMHMYIKTHTSTYMKTNTHTCTSKHTHTHTYIKANTHT